MNTVGEAAERVLPPATDKFTHDMTATFEEVTKK